jgi:hypothetical protein
MRTMTYSASVFLALLFQGFVYLCYGTRLSHTETIRQTNDVLIHEHSKCGRYLTMMCGRVLQTARSCSRDVVFIWRCIRPIIIHAHTTYIHTHSRELHTRTLYIMMQIHIPQVSTQPISAPEFIWALRSGYRFLLRVMCRTDTLTWSTRAYQYK